MKKKTIFIGTRVFSIALFLLTSCLSPSNNLPPIENMKTHHILIWVDYTNQEQKRRNLVIEKILDPIYQHVLIEENIAHLKPFEVGIYPICGQTIGQKPIFSFSLEKEDIKACRDRGFPALDEVRMKLKRAVAQPWHKPESLNNKLDFLGSFRMLTSKIESLSESRSISVIWVSDMAQSHSNPDASQGKYSMITPTPSGGVIYPLGIDSLRAHLEYPHSILREVYLDPFKKALAEHNHHTSFSYYDPNWLKINPHPTREYFTQMDLRNFWTDCIKNCSNNTLKEFSSQALVEELGQLESE